MLINRENYNTYYSEKNNFYINRNEMIRKGSKLTPNLQIKNSGQILNISPFNCKIHKGSPLFLTKQTF